MKKIIAAITVGAFLVGGLIFTQGPAPSEAMELEPPILKMLNTSAEVL